MATVGDDDSQEIYRSMLRAIKMRERTEHSDEWWWPCVWFPSFEYYEKAHKVLFEDSSDDILQEMLEHVENNDCNPVFRVAVLLQPHQGMPLTVCNPLEEDMGPVNMGMTKVLKTLKSIAAADNFKKSLLRAVRHAMKVTVRDVQQRERVDKVPPPQARRVTVNSTPQSLEIQPSSRTVRLKDPPMTGPAVTEAAEDCRRPSISPSASDVPRISRGDVTISGRSSTNAVTPGPTEVSRMSTHRGSGRPISHASHSCTSTVSHEQVSPPNTTRGVTQEHARPSIPTLQNVPRTNNETVSVASDSTLQPRQPTIPDVTQSNNKPVDAPKDTAQNVAPEHLSPSITMPNERIPANSEQRPLHNKAVQNLAQGHVQVARQTTNKPMSLLPTQQQLPPSTSTPHVVATSTSDGPLQGVSNKDDSAIPPTERTENVAQEPIQLQMSQSQRANTIATDGKGLSNQESRKTSTLSQEPVQPLHPEVSTQPEESQTVGEDSDVNMFSTQNEAVAPDNESPPCAAEEHVQSVVTFDPIDSAGAGEDSFSQNEAVGSEGVNMYESSFFTQPELPMERFNDDSLGDSKADVEPQDAAPFSLDSDGNSTAVASDDPMQTETTAIGHEIHSQRDFGTSTAGSMEIQVDASENISNKANVEGDAQLTTEPTRKSTMTKQKSKKRTQKPSDSSVSSSASRTRASKRPMLPLTTTGKASNVRDTNPGLSEDALDGVVLAANALKLLRKGGYTCRANFYCRPKCDKKTGELGSDYFETLEDFKRHLSVEGVLDMGQWASDEKNQIHKWVRMYVIRAVDWEGGQDISKHCDSHKPFEMLKTLGMEEVNSAVGGKEYKLPPMESKTGPSFSTEKELFDHLARHGLPDECDFSKVSLAERLGLEVFFSLRLREENTFVPFDGESTSPAKSRGSARKRRRGSSRSPDTPSVSSQGSKRGKTNLGTSKMVPRQLKMPSPSKRRSRVITGDLQRDDVSLQIKESAQSQIHTNTTNKKDKVVTDCSDVEEQLPIIERLLDLKNTDSRKVLETSLELLQVGIAPDRPLHVGANTNFSNKLQDVRSWLKKSTIEGMIDNTEALYVCGVPGIGKTTGVLQVCEEIIAELKQDKDLEMRPVLCHINASHIPTSNEAFSSLCQQMGQSMKFKSSNTEKNLLTNLRKDERMLIVVLDEIDVLMTSNAAAGADSALRKMIEWATNPDIHLVFIGISNSTGDAKYHRIQQLGKFNSITFSAYSGDDLRGILVSRIGNSVIEKPALEFITKRLANEGGDARKALEFAAKTVQRRLDELTKESPQGKTVSDGPLVKMKHVMQSSQEGNKEQATIIRGLPPVFKVMLSFLTGLTKTRLTETTVGQLRRAVGIGLASVGREHEGIPPEEFCPMLEMLRDYSLIRFSIPSVKAPVAVGNCFDVRITLGQQSADTVKLIERELGSHNHYKEMMAYAAHPQNEDDFALYQP